MPVSGRTLRNERRLAEITTLDLKERMGISRTTLYHLEKTEVLTVEQVERYRDALRDAIEASRAKVA